MWFLVLGLLSFGHTVTAATKTGSLNMSLTRPVKNIVGEDALAKKVEAEHPYNQTGCCLKSGMKPECLSLCSYSVNIPDILHFVNFVPQCVDDFTKVVRCAAGGRDHLPCCARRGVPKTCQPLCQAVHQTSSGAEFGDCLPYIERIFTCYEEGTLALPPPVRDLKAVKVEDGKVFLSWKSDDANDTFNTKHFEVFYKQVTNLETAAKVFDSDKQINTKEPLVKIEGLETGKIYRFFVISRNDQGTSLPSSIVTLNVSSDAWNGNWDQLPQYKGATSPPHLLKLDSHAATWLQFTWNTPAISHPEDVLKYRLYYKPVVTNMVQFKFEVTESEATTARINGLMPDTQYAIFATAVIVRNDTEIESTNSEELLAWTDPAYPVHVEIRIVRDHQLVRNNTLNTVSEGGSMTVLCIATGMPVPTVKLSIDGVELHSKVTKYLVTVVGNVDKDLHHISCSANNSYGTPMTATKEITVSRAPTLTAPMATSVMSGDTLTLTCKVDAFPAPKLAFYRDKNLKQRIAESDRVYILTTAGRDDNTKYFLTMIIKNANIHDGSLYYCHANNTMGEKTAIMGVTVKGLPAPVINVTGSNKSDIVTNKVVLHELESKTSYEVVKADNANDTDQLTEPGHFRTTEGLSAPPKLNTNRAFELVTAVFIIIGAVIFVIYILHKKNFIVPIVKKLEGRPLGQMPPPPPTPPIVALPALGTGHTALVPGVPFRKLQAQNEQMLAAENYNYSNTWSIEMAETSSESSSESNTPRSQEDTEVSQSGLMDKFRAGVIAVNHGHGFQRFL